MASPAFLFLACSVLALMCSSPSNAQKSPPAPAPIPLPPSPAPAPAPAPAYVNLTDLLSVAGPFDTFLNYLIQTKLIDTFQNQANNTDQGITIFVPSDAAFSRLKKPTLSNLTSDQLKSLLLYHALPQYFSLAEFKNLSTKNPVSTFAGSQYSLNFTDASGVIHVDSDWSNPKISSSVLSTRPVAVYEIQSVLLPIAIFANPPPLAPAPAPAPETSKPSDLSPSESGPADSPNSPQTNPKNSAPGKAYSYAIFFVVSMISCKLMLLL